MSPLGAVPHFITSFHPNSLGNVTALLLFLGQEFLDPESLVRRRDDQQRQQHTTRQQREERVVPLF